MEAEYIAKSLATWHVIWLHNLMAELGIPYSGATLNVDNQGAINYLINSVYHTHIKHINIQHHFIHKKIISNRGRRDPEMKRRKRSKI